MQNRYKALSLTAALTTAFLCVGLFNSILTQALTPPCPATIPGCPGYKAPSSGDQQKHTTTTDNTTKTNTGSSSSTKKKTKSTPSTVTKQSTPVSTEYRLDIANFSAAEKALIKAGINPFNQPKMGPKHLTKEGKRLIYRKELEKNLKEALKDQEEIEVKDTDGNNRTINKDTKIIITLSLEEYRKVLGENSREVFVIGPSSDSDDDGLSDEFEFLNSTNNFKSDSDGDKISDSNEVFAGSDPRDENSKEILGSRLTIPDNSSVGSAPLITGIGKANSKFKLVATNAETGETIELGEVETDENGKFVLTAIGVPDGNKTGPDYIGVPDGNIGLPDGKYFVYTNEIPNSEESKHFTFLKVNKQTERNTPELEVKEVYPDRLLADIKYTENLVSKLIGKNLYKKYLGNFVITHFKKDAEKIQRIVGQTEAEYQVVILWRSAILHSMVIADASQGHFELNPPSKLAIGQHEIFLYAYDTEDNFVTNLFRTIFTKV